jgi:UDPglucose 6-dehydrogenase
LIEEEASISVYDPKIKTKQMLMDLNNLKSRNQSINADRLKGSIDPYKSVEGSHAVLIITDWDEFSLLDWKNIYQKMSKPAFIFDGRKILNKLALEKIGFKVFEIGKE